MAKVLYTQHLADGTTKTMRHATKQGSRFKPDEAKNSYTIVVHMTKADYEKFVSAQRQSSMKMSAFGRIVFFLGINSYLNQIIS